MYNVQMRLLLLIALALTVPVFALVHAQSGPSVSIVSDASTLGDKAFDPNPITINKGESVVWTNKDFGIHTITENDGLFSSDNLRPDQTFEHKFDQSGTFEYHCKLHPTMTGKVIVVG